MDIFIPCANVEYGCENLADTRTGGDMNPYGPVTYKCDECIDADVAAHYG